VPEEIELKPENLIGRNEGKDMKAYRLNEADIMLPDYWKDTTINAFILPSSDKAGEAEATFVITRDNETKRDGVEHFADTQLVEAAKKLNRYKFIERQQTRIGNQPAIQVDYTWVTPERIEIRQRQAYVKYQTSFLIFTLSVRASDFEKHETAWENAIASVNLRQI
jgi:hypothetical protein